MATTSGTAGVGTTGALTGGGSTTGGSTGSGSTGSSSGGGSAGAVDGGIPADFWGFHVGHTTSFPVQVPYGYYRFWDNEDAQWPGIEQCKAASGDPSDPCFNWTTLDAILADLKAAGIEEVMYTLSRTPAWAQPSPWPTDGGICDYAPEGTPGQCFPPSDLNADGSGTDQIWKNWVTALATHANDPTYLQTHAHIRLWEPWNEFYRSTALAQGRYSGQIAWTGTYAQLVRLTEDARCQVKGVGVVHNSPSAGTVTPCGSDGGVDPSALISMPSGAVWAGTAGMTNVLLGVLQNYLYCTANPPAGSDCNTGDAGSEAADVINYHLYAEDVPPEANAFTYLPEALATLSPGDRAKPVISGEGSWGQILVSGTNNSIWAYDAYARAGFIARYFASYWSAGVSKIIWYGYDSSDPTESYGALFSPDAGALIQPEATGWSTTYDWLQGAMPTSTPFCSNGGAGTVYTCDFLSRNGKASRLVWDVSYGPPASGHTAACAASGYPDPWVCGDGVYTQVAGFTTWSDLSGGPSNAIVGSPPAVTIGAGPILLQ